MPACLRAMVLLAVCVSPSALQVCAQQADDAGSTLPLGVDRDRIRIDAIVTDESGRPALDLTAADFRVNYLAPGERLQVNLVSDTRPLDTIFLIDDPGISLPQFFEVQRALRRFIDNDLQIGQRLSILHFARSSGDSGALTEDRSRLRAAVDVMCWRPARYSTDLLIFMLQNLVTELQQNGGRKNLVIVTTSHHSFPLNTMRVVVDQALRAAVTIHLVAVDDVTSNVELPPAFAHAGKIAEALSTRELQGDRPPRPHGGHWGSEPIRPPSWLARASGGMYLNDGSLYDDLQRCNRAARTYYLLSWKPADQAFALSSVKDSFEPNYRVLGVRAIRPGVVLRTRDGFMPHSGLTNPRRATTLERRMLETITMPLAGTGLRVTANSSFQYSEQHGAYILSRVHLSPESLLEFITCDSTRFEVVTESLIASRIGRKTEMLLPVFRERVPESSPAVPIPMPIRKQARARAESPFFGQLLEFNACGQDKLKAHQRGVTVEWSQPANAGVHEMRYGVRRLGEGSESAPSLHTPSGSYVRFRTMINRDGAGQSRNAGKAADAFGSASSLVGVPDLESGASALTGPLFTAVAAEATPDYKFGVANYVDFAPPSFRPGSDVAYSVLLINLSDRARGQLRLESIVLHDGTVIHSQALADTSKVKPRLYRISGRFHIPQDAPEGQYLLGIAALDRSSVSKGGPATWADFEVRSQ